MQQLTPHDEWQQERAEIGRLIDAYGDLRDEHGYLAGTDGEDASSTSGVELDAADARTARDAAIDAVMGLEDGK